MQVVIILQHAFTFGENIFHLFHILQPMHFYHQPIFGKHLFYLLSFILLLY